MKLHSRIRGDGPPLILLHGLFGSLDNLGMLARGLEDDYTVISLDLRNHGRSPHGEPHSYPAMAEDVIAFMDAEGIASAAFYGHSMGGKTAMQIALTAPEMVEKLIVGDIAPVVYPRHHDDILKGMKALQGVVVKSRAEAAEVMSKHEPNQDVLSFLLTNLRRNADGDMVWRHGLHEIDTDYDKIAKAPSGGVYGGPTLFIKGGESDYISAAHRDVTAQLFPKAKVQIIAGAGHWFHAEKPDATIRIVKRFLEN